MESLDKLVRINVTHGHSTHFELNVELQHGRFRSPEDYVKTAPDAICQSEPPLVFRHRERERETLSFGDMQMQYMFVWEHSWFVHFDRTVLPT